MSPKNLNILNFERRGRDTHMADIISAINTFKSKLLLWSGRWIKQIADVFAKYGKTVS